MEVIVPVSSRKSGRRLAIQTAPQAAAAELRDAIISGELKGGDRILEQEWSSKLGIGQPTLREAMRELEHQGLLRKLQQRGTYVAELSPEDYRQILEVRLPLEAMAIGRAAARLTPELADDLTALVATMADTEKDLDVRRFHDCDVLFHRTIWEAADNPYLRDLLEAITFRLFVFSVVGRWPRNPDKVDERRAAVRQHVGILNGIKSGDAKTARRTFITETIDYWNEQYKLALDKDEILRNAIAAE